MPPLAAHDPVSVSTNPTAGNLYRDLPTHLPAELTEVLAAGNMVRIERIVSTGHANPPDFWYDQDEHEWVVVLRGSARLQIDGESTDRLLGAGDHLLLPAHRRHRVAATDAAVPTVWLAVFFR